MILSSIIDDPEPVRVISNKVVTEDNVKAVKTDAKKNPKKKSHPSLKAIQMVRQDQ